MVLFEPTLKDFLAHRKRNKEDTIVVLFYHTVVSKGGSAKKGIRETLMRIQTSQRVLVGN